jgi:hypothetical protein
MSITHDRPLRLGAWPPDRSNVVSLFVQSHSFIAEAMSKKFDTSQGCPFRLRRQIAGSAR